ncbi:mechanosensitive ion channel family protein [Castellaniella denitrificans]|uniref:Mechanosensitive ion channel family protein n=1 Tax=Castellaniella denitrificans TaxID=56119 RepID=A0ABT4M2N0_9BURK|nr:mechanosensitive ion channel family protein [Castellaniella denitrificans]MCZ4329587.1 mechanosensitive ion channel family protein [Castellaniella denitrificans]
MISSILEQATAVYHEWRTVILVFAAVLGALLAGGFLRIVLERIARRLQPVRHAWGHGLLAGAALPAQMLVWVLGIALAGQILLSEADGEFAKDSLLAHGLSPIRDVGVILTVMWLLLRAINRIQDNLLLRARAHGRELDPTAADAIGKLTKASVVITAILMMMQALGFSIAGLLAFGGMGGIAVGFAAQSLVANLLGGLTIFASRPFKVGEYIIIPGTDLMGGVEHIGWRATRLIGFDCKPFYVPNAMFNTQPVINHTRMTSRRIMEDIHIRYADIDAVPAIVADARDMLGRHPGVKHDFFAFNFSSCGTFSLKLSLYAFTVSTDYNDFMNVQEDVLLKIADIIRRHGARMTGPVSTVEMPQLRTPDRAPGAPETGGTLPPMPPPLPSAG